MLKFWKILTYFSVGFLASAATACTLGVVSGSGQPMPLTGDFKTSILDNAIRAETNLFRCKKGLQPLGEVPALRSPSLSHSNWMAKKNKLSHTSNVRKMKTLRDRVSSTNLRVSYMAENIAYLPLFDFGGRYQVVDRSKCQFRSASKGQIFPHTYASFAKEVVTMWINSPGHRKNLTGDFTHMAAAAALRSDRQTCGYVYATQMFVR